jgi:hypothetical protein
MKKIFNEREGNSFMKYGALISFPEDQKKIIEVHFDNMVANYSYSLDFITFSESRYLEIMSSLS